MPPCTWLFSWSFLGVHSIFWQTGSTGPKISPFWPNIFSYTVLLIHFWLWIIQFCSNAISFENLDAHFCVFFAFIWLFLRPRGSIGIFCLNWAQFFEKSWSCQHILVFCLCPMCQYLTNVYFFRKILSTSNQLKLFPHEIVVILFSIHLWFLLSLVFLIWLWF